MANVSFDFKDISIICRGLHFIVSGSGRADVDVDGTYAFTPGCRTLPNGDPGYPDESDIDVSSVELNSIEEIDYIDRFDHDDSYKDEQISEEEVEAFYENYEEEIEESLDEVLTAENCSFDEDQLEDIIYNQANDDSAYDDYLYDCYVDQQLEKDYND